MFEVTQILWGRERQSTLVFLLGKSQGLRSLVGYSPCDRKELDTTEPLTHTHTHTHTHTIGLAIKFLWYAVTEKPKQTFWPTQYCSVLILDDLLTVPYCFFMLFHDSMTLGLLLTHSLRTWYLFSYQ